ncbi:hypothetical protein ES703_119541 [subsurface metagenome]
MKKLASIATISIMLAIMATSIVPVSPVSAATVTFRPSGDVTIGLTGSDLDQIDNYLLVNEATSDGDGTYVNCTANTTTFEEDLYNLSDTTSAPGKINSVTVWINAKVTKVGAASAHTRITTNTGTYDGVEETLTTSYATYSTAYTTNPQSGNEWTWGEINALQAGVGALKATGGSVTICTQVYVVVDYTPATLESYKTVAHSIIWGTEADPYAAETDTTTAFIYGPNFTASHGYNVGYYDDGGAKAISHGVTSAADNTLSSQYILTTDPGAQAGIWHAVAFDNDLGSPPNTYAECSGAAGYVVEDSFKVLQSAIPEFPTIFAAIGVAGLCFGIYWWMRKRAKLRAG